MQKNETHLLAFLSIINVNERLDFQMGRTISCVNLSSISHQNSNEKKERERHTSLAHPSKFQQGT